MALVLSREFHKILKQLRKPGLCKKLSCASCMTHRHYGSVVKHIVFINLREKMMGTQQGSSLAHWLKRIETQKSEGCKPSRRSKSVDLSLEWSRTHWVKDRTCSQMNNLWTGVNMYENNRSNLSWKGKTKKNKIIRHSIWRTARYTKADILGVLLFMDEKGFKDQVRHETLSQVQMTFAY